MSVEIGAVYVGPKDAVGAVVTHHEHGNGHILDITHDHVSVDFYSNGEVKQFATAFAQQKPKLVKTNSEQGLTCLANVKILGSQVRNKDDNELLGWVYHGTAHDWGYQRVSNDPVWGHQTKHQAVKALVAAHNAAASSGAALAAAQGKTQVAFTTFNVDPVAATWTTVPTVSVPKSVNAAIAKYKKAAQMAAQVSAPAAPSTPVPAPVVVGELHPSTDWKTLKIEMQGGQLVGANPVKNDQGQIVAGEIHYNHVVVGYTQSNFDGTMKVFHADGTLVAEKAVPGSHHATDKVADHHSTHHGGQAELIAELEAKIKNVIENGKFAPTAISQTLGGLHNQPHLAYVPPGREEVLAHFHTAPCTAAGNVVYNVIPGAHLLKLAATHVSSLKSYTANGFEVINDSLRAGKIASMEVATHVQRLDKIFLKTPETEDTIIVFRGIDSHTASTLLGPLGSKVGQTFVEPGYSSCSALVGTAFTSGANLVMRITVPRGSHVVKPSKAGHYHDKEMEIILPREAKFLVMRDDLVGKGGYERRQVDLVFTGGILN